MRPLHLPLLAAAVLSVAGLGRWPLWQDEAFSWALVQGTFAEIVTGAAGDRHPPLYYLLMAPLQGWIDRDELVRLPSALAYVGGVALTIRTARRHAGDGAALVAGTVAALAPAAVLHAHNARMYALLFSWGAALLWGALEATRDERPRQGVLVLGLAAAGAVWTHYAAFAVIAAAGAGSTLGVLARRDLPWRDRCVRVGWIVLAFILAGVSFLPWALGPLRFQLANKDAPGERTLAVLAYALWTFDSRVPPLSHAFAAAQLLGVALLARHRDPRTAVLGAWVAAAIVFPWIFSTSLPAQNPRNYLSFLPAGALLAGSALASRPRLASAGLALLAVEPLWDLGTRRVSPQEPGVGFDYHLEADVFDASVPAHAGFHLRPTYMLTQYRRYAPALTARTTLPVDDLAWLAPSRAEPLDGSVTARYAESCVFREAFRVLVYAPEGPGCAAMRDWIAAGAADGYGPFQLEMGARAMAADRPGDAERWFHAATSTVRAHPAAWQKRAEVALRRHDAPGMLRAADEALAIARAWHFPARTIAAVHGTRARALSMLGRAAEAAAASEAARCARSSLVPTFCGTWAAPLATRLTAPAEPPPTLPPLPALSEPQAAPPPMASPRGTTRRALWTLDGAALPAGWRDSAGTPDDPSVTMETVDGHAALVLRVRADRSAAAACATPVDAATRMAVRIRWKLGVHGPPGWTRLLLEARHANADGSVRTVAGNPVSERPMETATPSGWRVDRFDFRPGDAAAIRLCPKLEGTIPGEAAIDWIDIVAVTP